MNLSAIIAALHLLALGIGLGSCLARGYTLRKLRSVDDLKPVFFHDNHYGIAALLWIVTGLWRAFGGLEKGTEYYLQSHAFWIKIGLFMLVFLLELKPMITLIRWRVQMKKNKTPELSVAGKLGIISYAEAGIVVIIVFVAVGMARGVWF